MNGLKIDLGCGSKKKEGTIGVDMAASPGVDHVVDFARNPLPFDDNSVSYVHLSHCMEHIPDPVKLFTEISRVCQDGARMDMWGPYAWENSAFIFDHKNFFNEDHFLHPCVWFPDFWQNVLHARWLLHGFTYVVPEETLRDIEAEKFSLAFGIKYLKGVVKEFCVHVEVSKSENPEVPPLRRFVSTARANDRHEIKWNPSRGVIRKPLSSVLKSLNVKPSGTRNALDAMPIDQEESGGGNES